MHLYKPPSQGVCGVATLQVKPRAIQSRTALLGVFTTASHLRLPGDTAFPREQVSSTVFAAHWLGEEPSGPLLTEQLPFSCRLRVTPDVS